MADILKCPFCGSADIRKRITISTGKVWCRGCGASISKVFYDMYGSIEEAKIEIDLILAKAWNRRATE